ncbi:MAG: site-2 protease family protein [Anaerolineales bacterium]|nr:site-2 protease family protein [Anaerolineales bacterium]
MFSNETDVITPIVARFLSIDDVTQGDSRQSYLVRYRGLLRMDSVQAYDQLSELLRSHNITPLFRKDGDRHTILLTSGVVKEKKPKIWVNLLLIGLTILSVFWVGILHAVSWEMTGYASINLDNVKPHLPAIILGALAFTASLLGILMAHEFGHYLVGRFHGALVTLPYFLPLPFPPFGTLGAFISLQSPPKNKRDLLDVGIAGPLSGLIVAIPVLIFGLSISRLDTLPTALHDTQSFMLEGNSILYLALKYLVFGKWLPTPADYGGLLPMLYWVRYFFTGSPFPFGGTDVMIHPVAMAGWAGILVTALNLIPAGQLDGGHLMYVLLGKRTNSLLPFILGGLVLLGMVWTGWWLWAFLIFLFGRMHAEPLDQITELDPQRRLLAFLGLIVFILVFTPVPMLAVGAGF